jgi:hypothetical protein
LLKITKDLLRELLFDEVERDASPALPENGAKDCWN